MHAAAMEKNSLTAHRRYHLQMLITPNYSAISVLHEGELRPFAEGKVWKKSATAVS